MEIKLNEQGLVPAIAQDINTGQVLMLGYMNPGSLKRTVEGTQVWYYSRSREDLWHKGEVSGNYLNLREAYVDCDADTILLKVEPDGPTCHTGETSCFFTPHAGNAGGVHRHGRRFRHPGGTLRTGPGQEAGNARGQLHDFTASGRRRSDSPEGY